MVKPYQHLLFQPEIQRRAELPAGTVFDYGGRPLLICKVLGTDKAAPVIVEELTDAVALKGQLGIWSVDGVARQMTRKR